MKGCFVEDVKENYAVLFWWSLVAW